MAENAEDAASIAPVKVASSVPWPAGIEPTDEYEAALAHLQTGDGHLFVTGPGGVWILSPDAKLLGILAASPEEQHNLAWGDEDGRTLYMTALGGVYRIRTKIPGVRP